MAAYDAVKSVFGSDIPGEVLSEPKSLGVFYIPPSGITNGGRPKDKRILNLSRALFDEWLRSRAESFGVHISYDEKLVSFIGQGPVEAKISCSGGAIKYVSAHSLVGGDGVFSGVRNQLYGDKRGVMRVAQESWSKTKEINDFYIILDDTLSKTYSYIIPKAETIEIGQCLTDEELKHYPSRMESLRTRLESTLGLSFKTCIKKSLWAIPYGFTTLGKRNVLLVGDAAGLCNPLTGEGIKLGIDSGEAAGSAVADAFEKNVEAISLYSDYASALFQLVIQSYLYSFNLNNCEKEKFVARTIKNS
jgi:flavin-dependent dehydrogenase